MINIRHVTLEGPDLSGKSTLMKNLHSATNNKYNIIDRSLMSALVYSILYKRNDIETRRKQLRDSLNNLNDRTIVLMPPITVLADRYKDRGDEIQKWEDIIEIYSIYTDVLSKLQSYSTVCVIDQNLSEAQLVEEVDRYLKMSENNIPHHVEMNAFAAHGEAFPVRFEVNLGTGFMRSNTDALDHKSEKEYYTKILSNMLTTITKENIGDNPYNKPQDSHTTRRYIYADDTCIALFHMMYRKDRLNFFATLRSSDTVNIFEHDYKFLLYLCGQCAQAIGLKDYEIPNECTLAVTINSAHMI
jgi:thymidylate kinase